MEISPEQEQGFQLSTSCSIYNQHFKEDDEKVLDNCDFTVKYRGACNMYFGLLLPILQYTGGFSTTWVEFPPTFDKKQG